MGFQNFKCDYLKATVPEKKVDMISLIGNLIDKYALSIFFKSWIALALEKFENISDISPFIEMLNDSDLKVRIAAARALVQLGDKKC